MLDTPTPGRRHTPKGAPLARLSRTRRQTQLQHLQETAFGYAELVASRGPSYGSSPEDRRPPCEDPQSPLKRPAPERRQHRPPTAWWAVAQPSPQLTPPLPSWRDKKSQAQPPGGRKRSSTSHSARSSKTAHPPAAGHA